MAVGSVILESEGFMSLATETSEWSEGEKRESAAGTSELTE